MIFPTPFWMGICRANGGLPQVESDVVPCEEPGCGHEVFCDANVVARANRARCIVLCDHCCAHKMGPVPIFAQ
jgi:hypothetical protein